MWSLILALVTALGACAPISSQDHFDTILGAQCEYLDRCSIDGAAICDGAFAESHCPDADCGDRYNFSTEGTNFCLESYSALECGPVEIYLCGLE
jgi:hypothetical protein